MNIIAIEATIAGKNYRVQHPGNRKNLELQSKAVDAKTGRVDQGVLFDYMFEHCVEPIGNHPKPNLDEISPAEVEEWGIFLPSFLRGLDISKWRTPRSEQPAGGEPSPVSDSTEEGGSNRA